MAFMEWEFNEGGENEGSFVATGKVIEQLRRLLAKGDVDQAVGLYESCVQETVGAQLWAEFTGASTPMKKSIANLFYRSRDYGRAAVACEELGEWSAAAKAHAASYQYAKAGECLVKKGDKLGAARMLEKAGEHRRAAEIYFKEKRVREAAGALEKAGDPVGAGQLFIQASEDQRAAQVLAQVAPGEPRFIHAVGLLSEVLVRMGRRDLAAQRLAAALPSGQQLQDKLQAELAYRLGRLMWEGGKAEQARTAFNLVAGYDAGYKDVQECLRALNAGTAKVGQVTDPFAPVDPTVLPSAGPRVHAATTDPFAVIRAGSPLEARTDRSAPAGQPPVADLDPPTLHMAGPPRPATTVPIGYVQRMQGYEVLKQLPIFAELTLDEMKAFYQVCQQVSFPAGAIIIEQGHPGTGLYISREGHMQVSKVLNGGQETVLARLPPGKFVGEMSLVDDVPTSARVKALDEVKTLFIDRQRFETFMFEHDLIALRVYKSFVKTLGERLRQQNAAR
ncbi:MAG: cyclic nucleotide-binding domain-containing protein [Deltaproteobacteria bacterium]|nr:cyclic nucleotide-binding domain-containing protein [Deltaproteobacteria bacterium]